MTDRKPVWINGRQIYILPWARVWDVLLAVPGLDLRDVRNGRALLMDGHGRIISPDDQPYSGQKIFVQIQENTGMRDRLAVA